MTDKSITTELLKLSIALEKFKLEMGDRLTKGAIKGARGWDDPRAKDYLEHRLDDIWNYSDIGACDYIDIANYAMFLWWLEEKEKESG